ncbi:Peroxidasin [Apis cerana cerana]|uniref:Peroxidasin n=1 Tax=Apis cerana cerana TaxID=94128 RepID=A0A2A3E3N5_APICC|nr:Peroxidasin [Apis cerana cerana]
MLINNLYDQQKKKKDNYLYGIDHDLQARARAGIEAERFTYQTKARYQNTKDAPCRIKGDRPCPPSKYRTPSGTCNNVRHPVWGARSAPFLKMLPPAYSDVTSQ